MGAVDFSIDVKLVDILRGALPLRVFVETGTFEGEAVNRVLRLFDEIHSVEHVATYAKNAAERFRAHQHVEIHCGNAPHVLRELSPRLQSESVLYWLDAHWCDAEGTAGIRAQCPLLEELSAIGRVNDESVVLIDDARLFLAPPPPPHTSADWPRLSQIVRSFDTLSASHEFMVVNDVIAFFPARITDEVVTYASSQAIDWLAAMHRLRVLEEERILLHQTLSERLEAIDALDAEVKRLRVGGKLRSLLRR